MGNWQVFKKIINDPEVQTGLAIIVFSFFSGLYVGKLIYGY